MVVSDGIARAKLAHGRKEMRAVPRYGRLPNCGSVGPGGGRLVKGMTGVKAAAIVTGGQGVSGGGTNPNHLGCVNTAYQDLSRKTGQIQSGGIGDGNRERVGREVRGNCRTSRS